LLLHQLGAHIGERLHDAFERGAHLGLELPVLAPPIVEFALGLVEPRLVRGERDAVFGAAGDRRVDGAALYPRLAAPRQSL
jgi:hypothetical protein